MAFVFRSEKKSLPTPQKQLNESEEVTECLVKPEKEKPGVIYKGLPHILQKQHAGSQKENCLPDMQAHPIHSPSTFNFNNTVFKLREFSDAKISQHGTSAEFNNKTALTVKEIIQKKEPFTSNNRINNLAAIKSQKILTKMIEEKPNIVNKNLLRTMMHMSQKSKETNQIDKIVINESKQVSNSIRKNNFKGWQSLKKLSPLKEYRGFSKGIQSAETENLNILCAQNSEKPEKCGQKSQKTTILKQKQSKQKDAQNSQYQEQYEDDATPGPGAYSYEHLNNKKQFRSKRSKFQKIFYSQIQRFKDQQKKFQEVTYVNDEQNSKEGANKNNSVCQSFLSKSPKFKESQEGPVPPPGYYDTRQTLQHDLVRHILKSSNTTTFINRSPRSFKVQGKDMPGPGTYTLDRSFQKLLQQRDQLSYSYKSQLQRKLQHSSQKRQQISKDRTILDQNSEASVIHVKEDAVLENYYITQAPPFMSSTDRFPKLKTTLSNQNYHPRPRQSIPLPNTVKEPFNSSQKRETFGRVGQGVGIGLYNLNKDIWSKKSYNILFN